MPKSLYIFLDASDGLTTYGQIGDSHGFRKFEWHLKRDLGSKITCLCDEMLSDYGASPSQIDRLGVCTGPGSLTGLRIALSFIRTVAFEANVQIAGIDLFRWSAETIKLMYKPQSGFSIRVKAFLGFDFESSFRPPFDQIADGSAPKLVDCKSLSENLRTFGVRFSEPDSSIEAIFPDSEILHNLMIGESPAIFTDVLDILPMYVVPSQAELNMIKRL